MIAFPLRLKEAFLRRCEEPEAIVVLVRVMAHTPHGSWNGSAHFGLRDFFENARLRPELPQFAIDELNQAFRDLGIASFRVVAITRESPDHPDVDSYVVDLASTLDGARTWSLKVER